MVVVNGLKPPALVLVVPAMNEGLNWLAQPSVIGNDSREFTGKSVLYGVNELDAIYVHTLLA